MGKPDLCDSTVICVFLLSENDLDEVDRAALRRMTKDRVGWTPQEDSLVSIDAT